MPGRWFVDTNVILYAASDAPSEAGKHSRALELLDSMDFCVSAQVVQEFYVNAIRKGRGPSNPDRVRLWVSRLSLCVVVPIDLAIVEGAIAAAARHRISYWDAAILAAAESVGADNPLHRRPQPRATLRLGARPEPFPRSLDRYPEPAACPS